MTNLFDSIVSASFFFFFVYFEPSSESRLTHCPLISQTQKMDRYENAYLEEELVQPTSQNIVDEEELLAAQAAAEAAAAQQLLQPGGAFHNVGQGLTGRYRDMMMQYWQETINSIEHDEHDFKNHQLPLARIKKVMKTDEDVRMISAEAPILFAKGCDVFITELTMRAWIHAEEHKRRTLQKSDIAAALTKSDMFDFLIDVVPREEEKPKKSYSAHPRTSEYVPPVGVPTYKGPIPSSLPPQSRFDATKDHHQLHLPPPITDPLQLQLLGNDQYQQQQQQNILQQHLLQQQMIHQQHLQQQQQQQQQQHQQHQRNQDSPHHHQPHSELPQTLGPPQTATLHQSTPPPPTTSLSEQAISDEPQEGVRSKAENEQISHDADGGDGYAGFQGFNLVVYEEYN